MKMVHQKKLVTHSVAMEVRKFISILMTGLILIKKVRNNHLKTITDFFPKGSSQGKEADYYIVEPDPHYMEPDFKRTENKPFIRESLYRYVKS